MSIIVTMSTWGAFIPQFTGKKKKRKEKRRKKSKFGYYRRHLRIFTLGVPIVAQWLTNPTRNHDVVGSIPDLAQWVKDLALP